MLENERIDDLQIELGNGKSLSIIQNPFWFCFGVDAVLLADFSKIAKGKTVVDLGTGNGIIPLLVAAKTSAKHITGVEIQKDIADMAVRSVALNEMSEKITIINEDLKTFGKNGICDVVICNPPIRKLAGGLKNPNSSVAIARHEIKCTLSDVIESAARLLNFGGTFNIIHRPERLVDIICGMRKSGLEPKRIRYVHPYLGKSPTMVLIGARKGGNPKIITEPPLFIYDENGDYSDEIKKIYRA